MKNTKFGALIAALILLVSIVAASAAEISENYEEHSLVMALNDETMYHNGIEITRKAPIMVYDKIYVSLYDIAAYMDFGIQWQDIDHIKITKSGRTAEFKRLRDCSELRGKTHRFFVKDNTTYISLNDAAILSKVYVSYKNGIIKLGNPIRSTSELFGEVNLENQDDFIRKNYPIPPRFVVNPYRAYSHENMMKDAGYFLEMYPELISTSVIGKSVEGRDLLLIEFGKGPNKIFVCGTHHAREYIATSYLMYAIERYAYAYHNGKNWGKFDVRKILDNVTFCIVPMVNPDGVNLVQNGMYATKNPAALMKMDIYEGKNHGFRAWKANINGVDVNWNYDKDWDIERNKNGVGSTGFNGYAPATEPETVAISKYVDENMFDAYLSFHTQGQIFYWNDSPEKPLNIHKKLEADCGFIPVKSEATGVGGSFFDYVYRKYEKPTITFELCPYVGNYPYPDSDFDKVWWPARNLLLVVGNEIIKSKK